MPYRSARNGTEGVSLLLCGDVMTGRGVDQILPRPNATELREPNVRDARAYVELAERVNGAIARPVGFDYIWGDALGAIDRIRPHARIVNLETSVTSSDAYWPGKAIHYRMHPQNVGCLTAAGIDVCVLANNHVLDFGYAGLDETLRVLEHVGIRTAGAGLDLDQARRPAIIEVSGASGSRRVIVFSCGSESSGIPAEWAATASRPGVDLLEDLSDAAADSILDRVRRVTRPGDVVIASIHWGSNWGYDVPESHVRFASRLLHGEVDIVHGHSSHHPRPMHIINGKLALFGCGECINDYEGIGGYEAFRGDLVLMYFPTIDPDTGTLARLRTTPLQIRRMQLTHASERDARWLEERLARISRV